MTTLTKDDIHAIRNANDICVHLNARHPTGLVRLIKRKPYNAKPFEQDREHVLTAKAAIEIMRGRDGVEAGTVECFAMAGIYSGQRDPVFSVLNSLRVGDDVTFSFYPDCHTNGYVAAAGLHADVLYMYVIRNGKRHCWELIHQISPANSARMCRGVPNSSDYDRQAQEGRKLSA